MSIPSVSTSEACDEIREMGGREGHRVYPGHRHVSSLPEGRALIFTVPSIVPAVSVNVN